MNKSLSKNKKYLLGLFITGLVACQSGHEKENQVDDTTPAVVAENEHPLLTQYRKKKSHKLLDWSHVGYKNGNANIPFYPNTHNVLDFGAIADDGKDDREAVQNAINAASVNGGVVFFPEGIFDFWTGPNGHSLEINASNVVLRGSGTEKTKLKQHNFHQGKIHYHRFYLVNFDNDKKIHGKNIVLIADAKVHDKKIKVKNNTQVKAGDVILLQMLSKKNKDGSVSGELARKLYAPLEPEPLWTRFNRYIPFELMVTVKEVAADKKTIYLDQPLAQDFLTSDHARISLVDKNLIENVGIEDLTLVGKLTDFSHHRSYEDDYGWNAIQLKGAKNSWVRNIKTEQMGTEVVLTYTGFSTVENILNNGEGHSALLASNSDFNLFKDSDFSGFRRHVVSFSGKSAGNVFTNINNNSGMHGTIDFHGGGLSTYNLIENSKNLRISSGGAPKNMPHAGQYNTLWNIVSGPKPISGKKKPTADDMFTSGYFTYSQYDGPKSALDLHILFPKTILVGITNGDEGITVAGSKKSRDDEWLYVDSIGQSVKPTSLYSAQKKISM